MKATIERSIRNQLPEVRGVSDWLKSFADHHHLPLALRHDLDLALTEWLTNVISYGFGQAGEHLIRIRLACDAQTASIEVEDEGRPFNPLDHPPVDTSAPLEERPVGGLGIHLIRRLMDSVDYRRDGDRNVLVMVKRLR